MRRIVAALVVAALAVTLTACGGGGEEPAETEAPDAAATAPAANTGVPVPNDLSPEEPATYEPLVTGDVPVPESVAGPLQNGDPFILVFYDNDQPVTNDQKEIVGAVVDKYRDMVDLVTFDIGTYVETEDDGTIVIQEEKLLEDENAKIAVEFARAVGVNFTPYVIVVDKSGNTTYRGRGLVDGGTLDREVLRVGE